MKKFLLILSCLFSMSAFAQDCASNLTELKALVGNNAFPTKWAEKDDKNPFLLQISERNSLLNLRLTTKDGEWAMMDTRICKKNSEKYVAEVKKIVWGPAAPEIAKGRNVKEVGINLPYHSMLKVSISIFWSGEFGPIN
ncbi:hypothetical protein ACJVC5_19545 [Peredibacter sp. HCB2-198]|uniref:hypothetical protein n=1 Tax=Peredibacter sp. HCB2-198 TaxID=3383025 RepID=UPI0038B61026